MTSAEEASHAGADRIVGDTTSRRTDRADQPLATAMVVAGTAGGAGATTVAALFAAAIGERTGSPTTVSAHSPSRMRQRLLDAPGLDSAGSSSPWAVHDLGPHATTPDSRLHHPASIPVLVAPVTPLGALDLRSALEVLRRSGGAARRCIIVGVARAARAPRADVDGLAGEFGALAAVVLSRDPALSGSAPVDITHLSRPTALAVAEVLGLLRVERAETRVRAG